MSRVILKIYAEVMKCNEDMTISTHFMGVSATNPKHFPYKVGMISLKYHFITEIYFNGKVIRNVMKQHPRTYYFGDFVSVDELIAENVDGRYTDLLMKISEQEGIAGIVTNPEGFKSMIQENDVVVKPKIEKDKVKSKKGLLTNRK